MTGETSGSLTREIPYWTVRDGAVVLRDGSYRIGFDVTLPGTEMWDGAQLARSNDHLRTLLNAAVPEGECLRVVLEVHRDYAETLRAYADGCPYLFSGRPRPPPKARHRAEPGARGGRLTNYRLLFDLSYHPARRARRWWAPVDAATYARHVEELRSLRDAMIVHAERAGFRARPLADRELVAAIWRYLNPGRKRYAAPPPVPDGEPRSRVPRHLLAAWPRSAAVAAHSGRALGSLPAVGFPLDGRLCPRGRRDGPVARPADLA